MNETTKLVLHAHVVSSLAMLGLIWFVQIVHYPLFGKVGLAEFSVYEQEHQRLTTYVVAPLMLIELFTAGVLLWLAPKSIPTSLIVANVALIGVIWASTFFWQVPLHEKLAEQFSEAAHSELVNSNWLRTIVWSLRAGIVMRMFQLFN